MNKEDLLRENSDDLLNAIYWYEQNDGTIYTKEFKKIIQKINRKREENFQSINEMLNYLDNEELKLNLLKAINDYADTFKNEMDYSVEHYYKYGFKDAIALIFEAFNYKTIKE